MHPRFLPTLLRLPDVVFTRVARGMLKVDPKARSSMWEDLQRGRRTEIDVLQGEIMRRAAIHGLQTPVISRVHALVKNAEAAGEGSPCLPPSAVC